MVSIVIPHFNDLKLLERNIPKLISLLGKANLEHEIIVSDDASSREVQGKLGNLQAQYEPLKVILASKNKGFGPTVNRGVKEASGDVVFVLKNDVLPRNNDYFSLILKHFKDPKVFAVSSALESVEDGKKEIRGQGIVVFFRGFFFHFRTRNDFSQWLLTSRSTRKLAEKFKAEEQKKKEDKTLISAWADGGSSAFKRDIFLKLGGFNSIYAPFYWEDTDLGYFAWKAGYKINFEPKAILGHEYREGSIAKYYTADQLKLLNIRNQFNFVWCNGNLKQILSYLCWLPYHYAVAIKNGNWPFIKGHWLAELQAIHELLVRLKRKSVVKRSDDEVLAEFEQI